jgi:hypothetical protein
VDQKTALRAPEKETEQGEEPHTDEGEEGSVNPKKPLPISLQLLEAGASPVYVPNVAFEPEIKFFRNFPRVGAYFGAPVVARGSPLAVVAVDTLAPMGSGLGLPEEDRYCPVLYLSRMPPLKHDVHTHNTLCRALVCLQAHSNRQAHKHARTL